MTCDEKNLVRKYNSLRYLSPEPDSSDEFNQGFCAGRDEVIKRLTTPICHVVVTQCDPFNMATTNAVEKITLGTISPEEVRKAILEHIPLPVYDLNDCIHLTRIEAEWIIILPTEG